MTLVEFVGWTTISLGYVAYMAALAAVINNHEES